MHGGGERIAEEIRRRIRQELGLTVSIGVSWNEIFAKLGSDMKKTDAVTVITPDNYRSKIWLLPAEELLYVGKATKSKLNRMGILTIGDLAQAPESVLTARLGKWGSYLHAFANGLEASPVITLEEEKTVRSIGNSLTVYRDLSDMEEVKMILYLLADSVSARMRESGLTHARTVHLYIRASDLTAYQKQGRLSRPTGDVREISKLAQKLFQEVYPWQKPVRGLGISVSNFYFGPVQLDFFADAAEIGRRERLAGAIDKIRAKYGNRIIQLASVYKDPKIRELDVKGEHVIHPSICVFPE